ncbi:adenylate/guanylate cyclase domain-containing protein [Okeania sp. SIO1I7]|uniref:adenylate/guanylate cyclase domain-containing protein n=1 Tax=Okeania sp. SIO1I7 TaxID=2607772 RepID=UPI0025FABD5E|nr:adenylate/guanylate cyclase domain-containing protein [Okeania sp. SIO1I7]
MALSQATTMFLKSLFPRIKVSSHIPLRAILIVPFVVQIFGAVGLTGWLSLRNGQQAVNEVTTQLRNEVSTHIQERLKDYLEAPKVIAQINWDAINLGHLNLQDTASLTQQFWRQRFLFDSVNISAIYFGSAQAEFIGLGFQNNNQWQIGRAGKSTKGKFHSLGIDNQGKPTELLEIGNDYDPRIRPWYKNAVETKKPTWSDIYADFKELRLKITLVQPVYQDNNELIGVVGVDFVLSHIREFLQSLKIGKSGQTFIIERTGFLVASSTSQKPFSLKDKEVTRIKAENVNNSLISTTANYLIKYFGDFSKIKQSQQLEFLLNSKRQFLQVVPFSDGENLDWLIVVVVPEEDFMEKINVNTRTTIRLCLIALFVATVIGVLTSRWISYPVMCLSAASREIASGKFDQIVEIKAVNELEVLAESFNLMAKQLQQSFANLEKTNAELEERVEERTAALRQSEEKFALAFQASPDVITISKIADSRIIEVNDSFLEITGYSREEVIGKTGTELNLWVNLEERSNIYKILETQGRIHHQEINLRLKSGQIRIGLLSGEVVFLDGQLCLLSIVNDITERKEAAEALRKAEAKYRSIFENSIEGIFQTTPDGFFLSANPAFAKMYGYSDCSELIANIRDIAQQLYVNPNRRQEFIDAINKYEEVSNFESEIYRYDGSIIWMSEKARAVRDANGEILYYEGTVEDITLRKQAEAALRAEQEKSERLLMNILPEPIAFRLKQDTSAIADYFEKATILFSDIVGFTPIAARVSPIELVNLLNQIFSKFDYLAELYGLEKIKTIGDAYMVAGGLPVPQENHAEAIANMALDMQQEIDKFQTDMGDKFQIRIGINTGPVVAGVIGTKKFIYDLWGDAVNVASRMESSGKAGKIQVTTTTYELLKDKYIFQERGLTSVKGRGKMVTYWLLGKK